MTYSSMCSLAGKDSYRCCIISAKYELSLVIFLRSRAAAVALAKAGYDVFAGVRKPADGDSIAAEHPNIHSVILNVTDNSSIKAALAAVEQFTVEKGLPFVAVVANAGIVKEGPLEFLPMSDVRNVLEVNFFGALALVQAFMPHVRQHKGRVIFVSSFLGKAACPEHAAYCASKAAMNAAADCLRVEVALHGVSVSTIIPGTTRTPILAKHYEYTNALHAAYPEIRQVYPAKTWAQTMEFIHERCCTTSVTDAAILHSIASNYPKVEYFVGQAGPLSTRLMYKLICCMPHRLNDWCNIHSYH
jgi:NAD(P)-dependent dehydrogenase (short-subunit alcohol dehydrogenase family)